MFIINCFIYEEVINIIIFVFYVVMMKKNFIIKYILWVEEVWKIYI